ncbi:MAG: HPr(Ser) kinase/phosphatase [Burkholderiaceae bacterium]|nr:HPr(Ser) kinase/phosphatase [Burkholderiaceae bacterium]MCD8517424.1 HPr(Ser) kinase/phosphatase [Burkholderiaceae bacterium]MCD8536970.1 HPr(Ser) kinase/phosphatase [Burkholderiaceae bacterium]MCD8564962.1 HPr(Ser) kinase/phosphatase [Burkholderiaceae bacterium]
MLVVRELVDDNTDDVAFEWLAGHAGNARPLPDDGRAAADLIGHLNLIHPARIQVFGHEELAYYKRFDPKRRIHHIEELASGGVPAIILAHGLETPEDLVEVCERTSVPLLRTGVSAAETIDRLRIYLSKRFAPKITVHGVLMDVLGLGVLITGESGLGKSELALELVSRGHGLVADDAVELSRTAPHVIDGHCPALLQNMLEVRGLGLLNIRTIFGETSVRRKMKLKLIVHLVRASAQEKFERLPLQETTQEILGEPISKVTLQVAAGRNLAVLVEAAVRNTILKLRGIDTLQEFMEKQAQAIAQDSQHG